MNKFAADIIWFVITAGCLWGLTVDIWWPSVVVTIMFMVAFVVNPKEDV